MGHAALDRLLAVLVLAMAATGLGSLRAGSADTAWVFTLHAILGGALLVASIAKIRRSGVRAARAGRWRRLALGGAISIGVMAALTGGFAWVASGELLSVGSWTVLTLHAWIGLLVVPVVLIHVLPNRWKVIRTTARDRVSRRTVLAVGGIALAGIALFGVANAVERVRGGVRRFTGSRWLPTGGIPPITTFFGEPTPAIDSEAWRLTVAMPGTSRAWTLGEIRALGEADLATVLDCTSGWAIETAWRGVPLSAVVGPIPAGTQIKVTSVTGWSTVLSADLAATALLATGVAGVDLPPGNGAPCRLVVPDRRGLDWVKWVTDIRPA